MAVRPLPETRAGRAEMLWTVAISGNGTSAVHRVAKPSDALAIA
jgi:hypothetical protein